MGGNYRQGSTTADLMFCRDCGILVAVTCERHEVVFGSVNARCLDEHGNLGKPVIVSPQTLTKEEKMARWDAVWINNVQIRVSDIAMRWGGSGMNKVLTSRRSTPFTQTRRSPENRGDLRVGHSTGASRNYDSISGSSHTLGQTSGPNCSCLRRTLCTTCNG